MHLPTPSGHIGNRLHVAVICRNLGGRGSVPAVALRQARELTNRARVSLLSDIFPSDVDERLRRHTVTYSAFRFLRRFSHVPREVAFAIAAKRRLFQLQARGETIDFVHCHSHALVALAASSFRRQSGVPCGLVAHGDILSSAPGTYDWRLTQFYRWAIPRGYARSDLIVALSPHMRERAIASGADPLKIRVIPNGIALDEIGLGSAASSGREGTQPPDTNEACLRLLFVGTFNKRKGVDVLCRAARILKDDRIPFSLALVGVGPMQSSLERYVAENDLTGEIAFHGSVPRSQLGKWYQWANATCVPSLDEPLSTVVLESLIAGTPIVGSNVGGTPSMVQSGINGLLVEPNDASELAMALQQIARQPGYLAGLKRASAPSVAERFSWTNTGAQLFQAIEATINRASSEVRNRSAAIGPRA